MTNDSLRISQTNADGVHGNTKIKPGDQVQYEARWSRVIEVYPAEEMLKIYHIAAYHSSVKKIHCESVTGFRKRDN